MKANLHDRSGKKVGTVDLPEGVFGTAWNADLVHQALRVQMANRRSSLAHTKDRSEVRGGGRKPWRQKGTGRARHGSIRSPIWVGGGVAHGPTKDKKYSLRLNRKMRRGAMAAVFSKRLSDGEIKVIDTIEIKEPKTKLLVEHIRDLAPRENALLIISPEKKEIFKAGKNLPKIKIIDPRALNIYDLLKYEVVIIEKEALGLIEKHYYGSSE